MTSQHAAYAAVYPISDQLPLGQAALRPVAERPLAERPGAERPAAGQPNAERTVMGRLATAALRSSDVRGSSELLASDGVKQPDTGAEGPAAGEANRPFGLRFAVRPASAPVSLEGIRYDEQAQVALARDERGWVPLTDHSMGLTLRTTGEIPREDEIHDKS